VPRTRPRRAGRRSGCPVSIALETFGDRWSLLVIRDLMVRGGSTFSDFLASGEGIASNVLAERLQRLRRAGIVDAERCANDGRKVSYRLTAKGIDLAPVLLELLIWSARHERTSAPCGFVAEVEARRAEFLAEVRRRWAAGDRTPLLPRFGASHRATDGTRARPTAGRKRKTVAAARPPRAGRGRGREGREA
jgi:DNA-binding HxlR family transcriptional regulator